MNSPTLDSVAPSPAPSTAASPERFTTHTTNGHESVGVLVLKRLDSLVPKIRRRRDEIEQARRMPRDLIEALRRTGMFSLGVPQAIGGNETTPREIMLAAEKVATADGSAGWCAMIANGNNIVTGYMDEDGAREICPDAASPLPLAGIAAPMGTAARVDGGVRVSGRWSFATGIDHAEWAWAGCMVMENGQPRMTPHGPEIIHVCMPVSQLTVQDRWHVSGLCGTGSNDFTATDVFVPDRRIFALLDPTRHRREPLYRMPPLGLFVFQVASVGLGIARAALDELAELANTKVPTLHQMVLADTSAAQIDFARAEAMLGSARSFLYEVVEETWMAVCGGRVVTPRQIALGRAAATHAAEAAAEVTRVASRLAGGGAIYSSSSLQRHTRDADALLHHFTLSPHTWLDAGRLLLGRKTVVPVF